jgi:TonB family protein
MAFSRFAIAALMLALSGSAALAQEPPKDNAPPEKSTPPSVPAPMPSRIRVAGNVAQAQLVHQVPPVYPPLARAAGITGTVTLHAIIARDGSVSQLEYVSGPPLLMKPTMDAVAQWRYKPTLLNGAPVEVDTTISVIFSLGGKNSAGTTAGDQPPSPSSELPASGPPPPPATQAPPPAVSATPPPASGTLLSEIPVAARLFPDSAEGMKLEIASVFRTWWSGDKEKFAAQLDSFAIPDSKSWLKQSFGAEKGAALIPGYQKSLDAFKSQIWWICGNWCNAPDLMLKVEASELPRPAEETGPEAEVPRPLIPLQVENFMFTLTMGQRIAERSVFSFVYLDGAFRIVGGTYPFWSEDLQRQRRPTQVAVGAVGPDGRITANGAVQAAKMTHHVAPEYPQTAKKMHMQGTVHLHAVIGKDGRVKDIRVIDGDFDLAQAAVRAVRQWRYAPTLLNGQPVEVDTTISVVFSLGPR